MDDPDEEEQSRRVLLALADLAPTGERAAGGVTIPLDWFHWLAFRDRLVFTTPPRRDWAPRHRRPPDASWLDRLDEAGRALAGEQYPVPTANPADFAPTVDAAFGDQLAAIDQVRTVKSSLRIGWLFVAGRSADADGRNRRVFFPLVTIPVRVDRSLGYAGRRLVPVGDAEVTPLIDSIDGRTVDIQIGGVVDPDIATPDISREALARMTGLRTFARSLAEQAGFPDAPMIPAGASPGSLMDHDGVRIVAGAGVFAVRESATSSRAGSLRAWSRGPLERRTGFHSLYLGLPGEGPPPDTSPIDSPFVLTPVQSEAVRASRTEPLVVISGAPGTGKSHTIVAVACDALARGQSVLLAAKSDATVDALVDLLERAPGPDPIVFGSSERREALAHQLEDGRRRRVDDGEVDALRAEVDRCFAERNAIIDRLRIALAAEQAQVDESIVASLRSTAPGLLDPDTSIDTARALCDAIERGADGWWAERRGRRDLTRLRALADCPRPLGASELRMAVDRATGLRLAHELAASGGTDLGGAWADAQRSIDAARDAVARWLDADVHSGHRVRGTLGAVAAVSTALRSGRAARRAQLARIDGDKLTRGLPLWAGTLGDVDDLLPAVAGLFDVVILDEASAIDQPLAAPALLRGRRAIVVGDPRQLRHVSFLADAEQQAVLEGHGLLDEPELAARLDVRRNSAFDLAAGAAPVHALDEHFRSAPHLADFVARRLYEGQVKIASRAPDTTGLDCIDVERMAGERSSSGAVPAEVDWTIRTLRELWRGGERSVGVVTPFRAQSDAIEAAVLETFSVDTLRTLDLRIGTVHAFQGNERDVIVAPLGVGTAPNPNAWRFIEDSHLFTVLMTRARRRMILGLSGQPPSPGLLADYLAQADAPPGPPPSGPPRDGWTSVLAEDLTDAGVALHLGYPSGRHLVDICPDDPHRAVGIETAVHPGGPDAHIRRHLDLQRRGWTLLEAYPSKWEDRRGELVVELVRQLKQPEP